MILHLHFKKELEIFRQSASEQREGSLLSCPQRQPAGPVSLRDPGATLFFTSWAGLLMASQHFLSALASGSQLVFLLSLKLPLLNKPLESLLLLKIAYRINTDWYSLFSCSSLRQVQTLCVLRVFTFNHRK